MGVVVRHINNRSSAARIIEIEGDAQFQRYQDGRARLSSFPTYTPYILTEHKYGTRSRRYIPFHEPWIPRTWIRIVRFSAPRPPACELLGVLGRLMWHEREIITFASPRAPIRVKLNLSPARSSLVLSLERSLLRTRARSRRTNGFDIPVLIDCTVNNPLLIKRMPFSDSALLYGNVNPESKPIPKTPDFAHSDPPSPGVSNGLISPPF